MTNSAAIVDAEPEHTQPVRPDLEGACVTEVVDALLGPRDQPWLPAPVVGASSIVLLVLDGLGWHRLRAHGASMPVLHGMEGGPITSVVPSTTSSALTSIATGVAPGEHGLVGYRIHAGGAVLNTLRWTVSGNRAPPDPATFQPAVPFGGRAVPAVTRAEFFNSGFTIAHLRGTRFVGWRTTASLVQHCRVLVDAGEPFIYAYYDGIDIVAHAHGLAGPFFAAECEFADGLVSTLLDSLPEEAALVVTADHGQVDLAADRWVVVDPLLEMIGAQAGDARCRFLHALDGAAADLAAAAVELFGERAWVFSRDRLLDEGWLGPTRAPVSERVGDVVLCARDPIGFADPGNGYELLLRSGHGSLTADEMLVPLLAARGRR